jgi:uncharacterized protein (DUF1778 family)
MLKFTGLLEYDLCSYGYLPYIYIMAATKLDPARFDTRLLKSQKEMFELAARLGGFKSLSEFIVHSAQQVADRIIEKHNAILAVEADRKIFFDALINPPKANKSLLDAARSHQSR